MAMIKFNDKTNPEYTDLTTHVLLSEQRRKSIEERADRLERKIQELEYERKGNRRLIYGAVLSIVTGIVTTVFSILLNFN